MGICFDSGAQDVVKFIENIKVIAVKSIQVRPEGELTYLDVKTAIANTNAQRLQLRKRALTFFIGAVARNEAGEEIKATGLPLGADLTAEGIVLEPELRVVGETPEGINEVTFYINLGSDPAQVAAILTHLLNAMGNPAEKAPFMSVKGSGEVGLYTASAKEGWTFWSGDIDWELKPSLQPGFLFYYGYAD